MKRLFAIAAASAFAGTGALAGMASADTQQSGTLTVHLKCGCVLFNDPNLAGQPGAISIQGGLPVGVAAETPAASNPSGTAVFQP